jgi:hypothetical protein
MATNAALAPGNVHNLTCTLDTSQYADGDVLFDTQEVPGFFPNGVAYLLSVHVLDEDDQGAAFDLVFLESNQSIGTENSAPNISDANARKILGRVSIGAGDYYDIGGSRIATVMVPTLPLKCLGEDSSLYVAGISRGTGTYSASGLKLKLGKAGGSVA